MEKDQFELEWAYKSGFTIQDLRDLNIWAIPCDCNEKGCNGWQMYTQEYVREKKWIVVHYLNRAKTRLSSISEENLGNSWYNDVIEDAILNIHEALEEVQRREASQKKIDDV